uniref:Lsm14-like N-terminal domain-containing protein n=1 Tax=Glossina palpalis gambiensis TaxID=67801 RepID=A0A1B0BIB7_9MUSC
MSGVDPQERAIALSSMRSFRTKVRYAQYQIAPQGQIYDYILFRGSDIEDKDKDIFARYLAKIEVQMEAKGDYKIKIF